MAGLATAPTSSTERAAATPVTGLSTDRTVGGLTTIPDTAIEASDTDITGNILGQGDLHKTAAIAQAREPRMLTPLDRMNLPKGGEEGTSNGQSRRYTRRDEVSAQDRRSGTSPNRIPRAMVDWQTETSLKVRRTAPFLRNWTDCKESFSTLSRRRGRT